MEEVLAKRMLRRLSKPPPARSPIRWPPFSARPSPGADVCSIDHSSTYSAAWTKCFALLALLLCFAKTIVFPQTVYLLGLYWAFKNWILSRVKDIEGEPFAQEIRNNEAVEGSEQTFLPTAKRKYIEAPPSGAATDQTHQRKQLTIPAAAPRSGGPRPRPSFGSGGCPSVR